MIRYKIVSENTIFDRVHKNFIPVDSNNRDYQRYLRWIEEGNTPEPMDVVPPTPPPDADDLATAKDIAKKLRKLSRRLKELLPTLDINDIL